MRILKHFFIALFFIAAVSCNDLNKIATIEYSASGCIGREENELDILNSGNDTIALFKTKGEKTLQAKLNASQMESFKIFFKELKSLKENMYCTTEESYVVYYDYDFIKKIAKRCDWQGFYKLKKKLFILKE